MFKSLFVLFKKIRIITPTQKIQKRYLLGTRYKLDNEENKTEGIKGINMQKAAIKDMVKPCLKSTCRNFEMYISEFKLPLWSRPSLITFSTQPFS